MTPEDPLKQQTIQSIEAPREIVREQDKIQLILAYLFPLSFIPMLTVKDSEFVKWHGKQGVVIGIAAVALNILGGVLSFTCIVPILTLVASLGLLVVDILAMIKALNGERYRVPLIGQFTEKL
jgi:uncharacterized membrane protein